MKTPKRLVRGLQLSVAGLLFFGTCIGQSQITDPSSGVNPGTHPPNSSHSPLGSDINEPSSPFPETSAVRRNSDRQKRLVSDTQRLLALTAQLKAEVASSGAQTLTPEMLRQMDDIEKLARSVKDKMKN